MPKIRGHADLFRDWEGLAGACERNSDLLPGMEPVVTSLREHLDEGRLIKLEQEHLEGLRKGMTQRLLQTLDDGKEAARKVRAFVLTIFHSRAEQLTQFGITPNRTRKRKTELPKPPAPPAPEIAAPTLESAAPPAAAGETVNQPAAEAPQ